MKPTSFPHARACPLASARALAFALALALGATPATAQLPPPVLPTLDGQPRPTTPPPETGPVVPAREGLIATPSAPSAPAAVNYETVLTWAQFDSWLARIEAAELTALDTETTSLDSFAARIVGISLSVEPGAACYIPLAHTAPGVADQLPRDEVLAKLEPWLAAVDRKKVLQNAKYDQHVFGSMSGEFSSSNSLSGDMP